jgi:release factor glutamine methyltransferase
MATFISRILRRTYSAAAQKIVGSYIKKDRTYTYKGLTLKIYQGVFHPAFFRSTKLFVDWLQEKDISQKSILELGCGSALISLVAAQKGANVTAVDINLKAVENAVLNGKLNGIKIKAFYSDMFESLTEDFDMVLINPPYFPKNPQSAYEHAWFCGEHFEYFEKLFSQIATRNKTETSYMIVSDSCDLNSIKNIAAKYHCSLIEDHSKKIWGEQFYIYNISSVNR